MAVENKLKILYSNVNLKQIQYNVWQSQGTTNLCGFLLLTQLMNSYTIKENEQKGTQLLKNELYKKFTT